MKDDGKEELDYRVVKCFVWDPEQKRILLLLRGAKAPTRPLQWDMPGGILEQGEDPMAAVYREIMEETSLKIKDIEKICSSPVRVVKVDSSVHQTEWTHYQATATSDYVKISWEHDEYKWVVPEEFLDHIEYEPQREAFSELMGEK